MQFNEYVAYCAQMPEFVAQFNRLTGSRMGQREPAMPIDALIGAASGYAAERRQAEAAVFRKFVYDCVWSCLDPADLEAGSADWLKGLPAQQRAGAT